MYVHCTRTIDFHIIGIRMILNRLNEYCVCSVHAGCTCSKSLPLRITDCSQYIIVPMISSKYFFKVTVRDNFLFLSSCPEICRWEISFHSNRVTVTVWVSVQNYFVFRSILNYGMLKFIQFDPCDIIYCKIVIFLTNYRSFSYVNFYYLFIINFIIFLNNL